MMKKNDFLYDNLSKTTSIGLKLVLNKYDKLLVNLI